MRPYPHFIFYNRVFRCARSVFRYPVALPQRDTIEKGNILANRCIWIYYNTPAVSEGKAAGNLCFPGKINAGSIACHAMHNSEQPVNRFSDGPVSGGLAKPEGHHWTVCAVH